MLTATEKKNPQEAIKANLELLLKAKEINVYGSQIMLTLWSEKGAKKAVRILKAFCSIVRVPVKTRDYNKINENSVANPTTHIVYRVHGSI